MADPVEVEALAARVREHARNADGADYEEEARDLYDAAALLREYVALTERLRELHKPYDEEAEVWDDDDRHNERFPDCPGYPDCDGHLVTVQVCSECGHSHDGEQPIYRAWPCPTIAAFADPDPDTTPATCPECDGESEHDTRDSGTPGPNGEVVACTNGWHYDELLPVPDDDTRTEAADVLATTPVTLRIDRGPGLGSESLTSRLDAYEVGVLFAALDAAGFDIVRREVPR